MAQVSDNNEQREDKRRQTERRKTHDHCDKCTRGVVYSESLPELSSELESEEWSVSSPCAAAGACDAATAAAPPLSKRAILSSRTRIFSASTSSSMLLRFRPPVPVPFPVRARLAGGARFGRMTKLYNFVKTAAGSVSISSSISSVLCRWILVFPSRTSQLDLRLGSRVHLRE